MSAKTKKAARPVALKVYSVLFTTETGDRKIRGCFVDQWAAVSWAREECTDDRRVVISWIMHDATELLRIDENPKWNTDEESECPLELQCEEKSR